MASYYCYDCLRKVGLKESRASGFRCNHCDVKLKKCKNIKSRAQTVTRLARHRGIELTPRKREYANYLKSKLWRTIRERVQERDNWTCQDCGKPSQVVHHESYDANVMSGNDDSKLVSLCHDCHALKHPDKIRSKRKNHLPRASADTSVGPMEPSKAKARAIPSSGEIGQHETGLSLAKSR